LSSNSPVKIGALARLYAAIAVWRRGPEDVPMSPPVLPVTALVYFAASLLAGWLANLAMPLPDAASGQSDALLTGVDVLFVCGWYWWLLRIFGRIERFRQTLSAVFGCAAVLALPSVMVVQLLLYSSPEKTSALAAVASLATLVMVMWAIMANAYILKSALERPLRWCVPLVVLLQVCEQLLALALLPGK
jgi:hypothetical protein